MEGGRVTEEGVQKILRLRRVEKKSYQDIALAVGLQKGTVEGIIKRDRG